MKQFHKLGEQQFNSSKVKIKPLVRGGWCPGDAPLSDHFSDRFGSSLAILQHFASFANYFEVRTSWDRFLDCFGAFRIGTVIVAAVVVVVVIDCPRDAYEISI